jgi:hypothetical protein
MSTFRPVGPEKLDWRHAVRVVGAECVVLASFVFVFVGMTALPAHRLTVQAGDAFPAYSLPDQVGVVHAVARATPRPAALYVFYRGDW